jgi:hypothetical protein
MKILKKRHDIKTNNKSCKLLFYFNYFLLNFVFFAFNLNLKNKSQMYYFFIIKKKKIFFKNLNCMLFVFEINPVNNIMLCNHQALVRSPLDFDIFLFIE